jgi:hypothetical protein
MRDASSVHAGEQDVAKENQRTDAAPKFQSGVHGVASAQADEGIDEHADKDERPEEQGVDGPQNSAFHEREEASRLVTEQPASERDETRLLPTAGRGLQFTVARPGGNSDAIRSVASNDLEILASLRRGKNNQVAGGRTVTNGIAPAAGADF